MIEKIIKKLRGKVYLNCYEPVNIGYNKAIKDAISVVQEVAKDGGWIPVTERLPEEKVDVLICYKDIENDAEETGVAISNYREITFGGRPTGYKNWIAPFSYFHQNYEIIAWQPLPAPYQKGE